MLAMEERMTRRPPTSVQYREVIGHFASGVTVVTTAVGERSFGTTANAVTSVSAEPPMLLVCLNRDSETGKAIDQSGYFVVNILTEDQEHLAGHFATKDAGKFDVAPFGHEEPPKLRSHERPLLEDALAHIECQVTERVTSATHIIFIGLVEVAEAGEGSPLAYYRGSFGRLEVIPKERGRHG
ncbi:MAG TPA: flavin reductase family protein [Solirubrobacterales bacterium]|nr:flavin reductase family protein [Solirubrobacterales bacterium]